MIIILISSFFNSDCSDDFIQDDALQLFVPNGIIPFGIRSDELQATATLAVTQVRNVSPILSLLLSGSTGSGKTAFTAQMAIDSG